MQSGLRAIGYDLEKTASARLAPVPVGGKRKHGEIADSESERTGEGSDQEFDWDGDTAELESKGLFG